MCTSAWDTGLPLALKTLINKAPLVEAVSKFLGEILETAEKFKGFLHA